MRRRFRCTTFFVRFSQFSCLSIATALQSSDRRRGCETYNFDSIHLRLRMLSPYGAVEKGSEPRLPSRTLLLFLHSIRHTFRLIIILLFGKFSPKASRDHGYQDAFIQKLLGLAIEPRLLLLYGGGRASPLEHCKLSPDVLHKRTVDVDPLQGCPTNFVHETGASRIKDFRDLQRAIPGLANDE